MLQIAYRAMQAGGDPAEQIYNLAKTVGYQPKAKGDAEENPLETAQRGQQLATGIGSVDPPITDQHHAQVLLDVMRAWQAGAPRHISGTVAQASLGSRALVAAWPEEQWDCIIHQPSRFGRSRRTTRPERPPMPQDDSRTTSTDGRSPHSGSQGEPRRESRTERLLREKLRLSQRLSRVARPKLSRRQILVAKRSGRLIRVD